MRTKKLIVLYWKARLCLWHFPSSTVEKICRRQKFICPACGQSLSNGEDIEVHHLFNLKLLETNATPNTQVKIVALHKLCHSKLRTKQRE
jgi:RNA-directed DNA polymerase